MTDKSSREKSSEVEVYGEFGLMPKVGLKLRHSRASRFEKLIDSATEHAELSRDGLEDRLTTADDRVRDLVAVAAMRAGEVDDDVYLDVLGRLIAGALDTADIDELAFVTSEVTKLEPVHLRAFFGFFWFGVKGNAAADPDLSPSDAAWASNRYRKEREIAYLLKMTREAASQVLLRLDREGLIVRNAGPVEDGEPTSEPSEWAGRVLSILFTPIRVEFRNTIDGSDGPDDDNGSPSGSAVPAATAEVAAPASDPYMREHRTIRELEEEIKKMERQRLSPIGLASMGGETAWLAALKRRLRKIDPDNPWTYNGD